MTDPENLPAIRGGASPPDHIGNNDTDNWIPVLAQVGKLAEYIAGTDFVPKGLRNNVPATAAAILYGREVGLPPMTSLTHTHVIDGRPALSAEAMRGLVLAAGHEIAFDESTGSTCTIRGRRKGSGEWTPVTWTIAMARAAGIDGKGPWRNYPRNMLQARATSELCRLIFPDVTHGIAVAEEARDNRDERTTTKPPEKTARVARKTPPPIAPPLPGETTNPPGAGAETATPPASGATTSDGEEGGTPGHTELPGSSPSDTPDDTDQDDTPPAPDAMTTGQRAGIFAQFKRLGLEGSDDAQRNYLSRITGRTIESRAHLTKADATAVIDTLALCKDCDELDALLDSTARTGLSKSDKPDKPTTDEENES